MFPLFRPSIRMAKVVALGVRPDGEKVLLGMMMAGRESTDGWALLIGDLADRGLASPQFLLTANTPGYT